MKFKLEVLMIPLLFSALVDTVVVDPDFETIRVHEWGVVQLDDSYLTATGAEWCFLDENGEFQSGELMMVDAPVVWFHGPDFTGSFTVDVLDGDVTLLYPRPMDVDVTAASISDIDQPGDVIRWTDLSFRNEVDMVDRISSIVDSEIENFKWALPFWREVPALTISRESDGWSDNFLYYECSVAQLPPYLGKLDEEGCIARYYGPALLFSFEDGELLAQRAEVTDQFNVSTGYLTEDQIQETLCQWAASNLKSSEIAALWNTWEPPIRGRCSLYGQHVLVFPLADHVVESISRLNLVTDQGFFVEYHRLFLGMTSI